MQSLRTDVQRLSALALAWGASLCLTGYLGSSASAGQSSAAASPASVVPVRESFLTLRHEADNVDSPALWHGRDGQHWVLATAKTTHQLVVYDAATGELVRRVGGPGNAPGQFLRPNGLAVHGDAAFVVERDNHRIQVLSLPGFGSLGFIGEGFLRRPYGLVLVPGDAPGQVRIYATDNYETTDGRIPPDAELGERVKRFTAAVGEGLEWQYGGAFGATRGPGRLRKVESIWADPDNGLLVVADEEERAVKLYGFDGRFTGEVVGRGRFLYEPEGIALHRCAGGEGYWVITDQDTHHNRFLVFRRAGFEYLGAFSGHTTANTDGVALTQRAFGPFSAGAFYAVHDDGGLGAFDWATVLQALDLSADCGASD